MEPSAFDEYFRLRGYSRARSIREKKAEVSKLQYSSKANNYNIRDFLPVVGTVTRSSILILNLVLNLVCIWYVIGTSVQLYLGTAVPVHVEVAIGYYRTRRGY